MARSEVSDGVKLTYARLAQFAGGSSSCYPKQATLARELAKSERTIRDHLSELERQGLIRRRQRGLSRSNIYELLAHEWQPDAVADEVADDTASEIGLPSPAESCRSRPAEVRRSDRQDLAGPEDKIPLQEPTVKRHTQAGSVAAFVRPSLEEVRIVADIQGVVPDASEKFYAEMEAVGWVNKHDQPLVNWQAALRGYGVSWRAVDHRARASRPASRPQRRPEARLLPQHIEPKVIAV